LNLNYSVARAQVAQWVR